MTPTVVAVNTLEDQETVAQMFSKYNFNALPVVDGDNRLLGIVTMDDAMDIMEEEATEDMEKMAAMTPSDKPYLSTGVFDSFKQRIPWLLGLMIAATITGFIITGFQSAFEAILLVAYIPLLMDTGGNSGSQTSVAVIRSLSLQEVEFQDIFRVIWKEFRVALLCGISLAALIFCKVLFLDAQSWLMALAVSMALLCTVLVSKIVGCTLPILAKRLGFDPTLLASPIVTTIVDIVSLLIYVLMISIIL